MLTHLSLKGSVLDVSPTNTNVNKDVQREKTLLPSAAKANEKSEYHNK